MIKNEIQNTELTKAKLLSPHRVLCDWLDVFDCLQVYSKIDLHEKSTGGVKVSQLVRKWEIVLIFSRK